MKHFSKLALAAGLLLPAASASATVEFQLTVDHPEYVKVSVDWVEVTVEEGTQTMTLDDNSTFSIDSRNSSEYIIQEVLVDGENRLSGSGFYVSYYDIGQLNGTNIEVHSCLVDDLRTGQFTITVDNPSRLSYVSTDGYPNTVVKINDLVAGEPYTVKYIPGLNNSISFNANGAPVYRLVKDGESISPDEYGGYKVTIEEGMSVEVLCDYPDIMAEITFNFLNDGADLFKGLYLYEDVYSNLKTEVEVVDNKAQVPLGSQILIEHCPSYDNYILNSYQVGNKNEYYIYSTYQTFVTAENLNITIDASLSDPVNVTFEVSGADGIFVSRKVDSDVLPLTDGTNPVTLYSSNLELNVRIHPSYNAESVKLNGEERTPEWNGDYRFTPYNSDIKEGDVISIQATPKETYKAYITVEDASLVVLKRNHQKWCEEVIELQNGRNELICSQGNNEFFIQEAPGGYISGVNLNYDEDVQKEYYGGYNFTVDEDYEVMVYAEPIVNEGDFVIYIDNLNTRNLSSFSWNNSLDNINDKNLVSGYNIRPFFHGYNPYKTQSYYVYGQPVTYALFVNDEKMEVQYPDYPGNELTLAPGDVVKIYLSDDDPQFYNVTFNGPFYDITYDLIKTLEVTSQTETANVLKGTCFEFKPLLPDDGIEYGVFVNSVLAEPSEDGIYHVEILEDTDIALSSIVGVNRIEAQESEMYYTIDGLRLAGRPTSAGIYIRVKGNKTSKVTVR